MRAAAWALVGAPIPPDCRAGVTANLAVLAQHLAIVRAADVPATTEAAEVFEA
jgi:hypothetical protein